MKDGYSDEENGLLVGARATTLPRLPQTPYRVAVTGHRDLGNQATADFVRRAFHAQLARLQYAYTEGVVAISGLAEGADTIFAQVALALHIPLDTIAAYNGLIADFPPGAIRDQYLLLRACSRSILSLPFTRRSNRAYMALGHKLVDSCDLLLAAWDGLPAQAKGGTGDVVAYALRQRKQIVHIHTVDRTITDIGAP